jgi:hypothetical protein
MRTSGPLVALTILFAACRPTYTTPPMYESYPIIMPCGTEGCCLEAETELRLGSEVDTAAKQAKEGSLAILVTEARIEGPFAGVQIELSSDSVFPSEIAQLSDAGGVAEWQALRSGTYWVRLQSIGYHPVVKPVSIRPGASDTLLVEFHVQPLGCTPLWLKEASPLRTP